MIFEIDNDQKAKAEKWLFEEVYPEIISKQKEATPEPSMFHLMCWEDGYPYEGAIGGGLSFMFTPNSIGLTTQAIYSFKDKIYKLDLTDYDLW